MTFFEDEVDRTLHRMILEEETRCEQCDTEPPYCPECGQTLEDNDLSRLWDAVALWVMIQMAHGDALEYDSRGILPFLTWP